MTKRRTIGNVPMFELNNLLSSDNNLTPNKSKKSGRKRGKSRNWIKVREFEVVEMQILLEKEKIGHIFIEVNVTMVNTLL